MVKAAVCKTVLGLFLSWVRFPPGPPNSDVAQWIEHQTTDLGTAGSSPAIRAKTIKMPYVRKAGVPSSHR